LFGKQVSGFTLSDITVVNGTASNLTIVDLATGHYTFTITATADGIVNILLPSGAAQDLAGNSNATSNFLARTVDRAAPVPAISSSEPLLTSRSTFEVLVNFGEEVTGFELNDIAVTGGTKANLLSLGNGRFTFIVTATADGLVTVSVPAGAALDLASNLSSASAPLTRTVDTTGITAVLSSSESVTTKNGSFTVTAVFEERALGFTLSDIVVLGGVASNLVEADQDGGRFTFMVTAVVDGQVTVFVPGGVGTDVAGNGNTASNLLIRTVDRRAPAPVLTSFESEPTYKTVFDTIIDFGEEVIGFTHSDISVSGGTPSNLLSLGNGRFSFTVTAAADGIVTVSIPAGVAQDLAGNLNTAATPLVRTVDSQPPRPLLTTTSNTPTSNPVIDVQIDFGKPVVGFTAESLVLVNLMVESFSSLTAGLYALRVKAVSDGVVVIGLASGAARDLAGNRSLATPSLVIAVNTGEATYIPALSTTAPPITSSREIEVTVDFGRAVTGFTLSDLVLSNATATVLQDLGSGRYRVEIQAIAEGQLTVHLPAGQVTDAQGRPNSAAGPLVRIFADLLNADFGDAPTASQSGFVGNYPSRFEDNGARHRINGLYLGTGVDVETDGQPTVAADGDDGNELASAAGIEFLVTPVATPGSATRATIRVTASQAGRLDGWIDLNRDGDWNDGGEQIFVSQNVVAGSQLLVFEIPAGASSGVTYARFRLSTAGGLAPHGPAADGEVEDYRLVIANGATGANVQLSGTAAADGEVSIDGTMLRVVHGAKEIFRAPASSVATMEVLRSNQPPLPLISAPLTSLAGTVRYSSATGAILASGATTLDLGTLPLRSVIAVDLTDAAATRLQLSAADIPRLSGSDAMRVVLGAQDQLDAGSGWRLLRVEVEENRFVPLMRNGTTVLTVPSATPWTNPLLATDVDGSGSVTPLDALLVINALNSRAPVGSDGRFRPASELQARDFAFIDVSGDSRLSPLDALLVINRLNQRNGSGEAPPVPSEPVPPQFWLNQEEEKKRQLLLRDQVIHELTDGDWN
jgi:hypothetical protein